MRYVPEVVVVDEATLAKLEPVLAASAVAAEAAMVEHPELAEVMARNGWTPRMVALGGIIRDFAAMDDGWFSALQDETLRRVAEVRSGG